MSWESISQKQSVKIEKKNVILIFTLSKKEITILLQSSRFPVLPNDNPKKKVKVTCFPGRRSFASRQWPVLSRHNSTRLLRSCTSPPERAPNPRICRSSYLDSLRRPAAAASVVAATDAAAAAAAAVVSSQQEWDNLFCLQQPSERKKRDKKKRCSFLLQLSKQATMTNLWRLNSDLWIRGRQN